MRIASFLAAQASMARPMSADGVEALPVLCCLIKTT